MIFGESMDDPLFVDTSIQIARKAHRPEIKASIAARLAQHKDVRSGLVVRQEFKRRLLKEAAYLLRQLEERNSYEKVRRHVQGLQPQLLRKMKIGLDLLATVDEADDDDDRSDRMRLMLRDLIANGVKVSEAHLSFVNMASGCACAKQPIIERKPFHYDFGSDKCSKYGDRCGVQGFLESNRPLLALIHKTIAELPSEGPDRRTGELARAMEFIGAFLNNPASVSERNPCLEVGDLLIALETVGSATMYTMNLAESRHLARILGQSLVFRHPNSDRAECQWAAGSSEWGNA